MENNGQKLEVEQRLTRIETRLEAMTAGLKEHSIADLDAHHGMIDRLGRIEAAVIDLKLREATRAAEMSAYKKAAAFISTVISAVIAGIAIFIDRFFR